jgi:hypothetical protein
VKYAKSLPGGAELKPSQIVNRKIRAAIRRHMDLTFVFAGSKTTLLNDMTLNPSRPFYRLGSAIFSARCRERNFRNSSLEALKEGRTELSLQPWMPYSILPRMCPITCRPFRVSLGSY